MTDINDPYYYNVTETYGIWTSKAFVATKSKRLLIWRINNTDKTIFNSGRFSIG